MTKTNSASLNNKNFKTKKRFGQCFLKDQNILKRIVELSLIKKEDVVLEIGPGSGALTKELLKVSNRVIAYEIDKDLIPILEETFKNNTNLELINEDILKANLSYINNLKENVISVSNLPYYITSPIIDVFLKKLTNVQKAIFMVQKEVGDRLSANVNTKDYNAFTILVNYKAKVKKLLNVSRTSFSPEPNVDSVVIEIEKYNRDLKAKDENFFIKIVESSFKERRKTLINNLSTILNKNKLKNILEELNLDERVRAERLTIDEFITLSDRIMEEL